MKTVIIAPHPDDEWIGCGCTMLRKINNKEQVKVLIVTRMPHSENRIITSESLANKYGYELKILGQPEKNINQNQLIMFLKNNIDKDDVVYVPDVDLHPDHCFISTMAQNRLDNKMYQYCVYNDPTNMIKKIWNKLMQIITGKARAAFRRGRADSVFNYKIDEKNQNIRRFGETKRSGDVLRLIRQ